MNLIHSGKLSPQALPRSLVVYEPFDEVRQDIIRRGRYSHFKKELATHGILFDYPDELTNTNTRLGNRSILALPHYIRNDSQGWTEFQKLFITESPTHAPTRRSVEKSIDDSTISYFSVRWTSHCLRAWTRKIRILYPPVELPIGRKKPLLFLGGGPNLEEDWDRIQKRSGDFYLLASDTSSSSLIQKGIIPDGVINVDPGRGSLYHLSRAIDRRLPIYTWMGGVDLSGMIPDPDEYPLYFFLTTHPLDQLLQQYLGWKDDCILPNPSRNIVGMAQSLSRYWGFDTFLYCGISFLSSGGKTHARGTGYESYYLPTVHRKKSLEAAYPTRTYGTKLSERSRISLQTLRSDSTTPGFETHSFSEWILSLEKNPNLLTTDPNHRNRIPLDYQEIELGHILSALSHLPVGIPGIHYPTIRRFLSRKSF